MTHTKKDTLKAAAILFAVVFALYGASYLLDDRSMPADSGRVITK